MSNTREIFFREKGIERFSKGYCENIKRLLDNLDHKKVGEIMGIFTRAARDGKTIYFIGNGGSAATATHFANDLSKGAKTQKAKFKALALADNLATFTAYANDDGYDYVFSKQLENLLERGDVLVSISASGNSPNLINAISFAKSKGATAISLLGFDGGKMKGISDVSLVINTDKGEYGPVEDLHMILDHLITNYLYLFNTQP